MALKLLLATAMEWPFPARLAQAFAALGARVEAVCPTASPLRHAGVTLHRFSFLNPLRALETAITAAQPDLVIPCDDLSAELFWRLGQARPALGPLMARSFGDPAAYPVLAARNDFLAAAADAGAPVAQNMALHSAADLPRAEGKLGYPLVLKADGSWGGDGVAIVHDHAQAQGALRRFARGGRLFALARALRRREPHLLVRLRFPAIARLGAQRFVTGHPATSVIACWNGKLLAANHFDVAVSGGGNGTGPATVVARADCDAMEMAAVRIAARFRLSGLYGLDYMRDAEGRIFLLEVNPRATPTSHLALGPRHDLAAALLSAAGQPVPDRPAATQKSRIALFPQELRRDPDSPHLAGAFHDLPAHDAALTAALMPGRARLTGFSQVLPELPALTGPGHPARR